MLFVLCVVDVGYRRVEIYYSTNYNKCKFKLVPNTLFGTALSCINDGYFHYST